MQYSPQGSEQTFITIRERNVFAATFVETSNLTQLF
jgi:hypothetical protein